MQPFAKTKKASEASNVINITITHLLFTLNRLNRGSLWRLCPSIGRTQKKQQFPLRCASEASNWIMKRWIFSSGSDRTILGNQFLTYLPRSKMWGVVEFTRQWMKASASIAQWSGEGHHDIFTSVRCFLFIFDLNTVSSSMKGPIQPSCQ